MMAGLNYVMAKIALKQMQSQGINFPGEMSEATLIKESFINTFKSIKSFIDPREYIKEIKGIDQAIATVALEKNNPLTREQLKKIAYGVLAFKAGFALVYGGYKAYTAKGVLSEAKQTKDSIDYSTNKIN